MPDIDLTRDVVVFKKGDCYAVSIAPSLARDGWLGGQGVQWLSTGQDRFVVEASDGKPQGFLLWGSDEDSDKFTAMTGNQPRYEYGVLGFGGWLFSTSTFERYTWASRQVGPLVEISYSAQDNLVMSLRGRWTKEDEWALAGDLRAPNTNVVGVVVRPPTVYNDYYLTVQTRL